MGDREELVKELGDKHGSECAELARKLYAEHGDEAVIYPLGNGELLAIAWNDRAADEYSRLTNKLTEKGADKAAVLNTFALAFVVHPSREEARVIFKKKPAFATKIAARAQELCGSEIEELGKA